MLSSNKQQFDLEKQVNFDLNIKKKNSFMNFKACLKNLKFKEQTILKLELESLKPQKQVYAQQPNSLVLFKSDIKTCLSSCKSNKYNFSIINTCTYLN